MSRRSMQLDSPPSKRICTIAAAVKQIAPMANALRGECVPPPTAHIA